MRLTECPLCGEQFYGEIDWAIAEKRKHLEQKHFQTNKSKEMKQNECS